MCGESCVAVMFESVRRVFVMLSTEWTFGFSKSIQTLKKPNLTICSMIEESFVGLIRDRQSLASYTHCMLPLYSKFIVIVIAF